MQTETAETETACEKIHDQGQKAALRNEVAGILKTAKTLLSNIMKQETEAIKTLSHNSKITILPADKGRTTVIMDATKYEQQMNEMLSDKNTYEILKKKNPTEEKKTERITRRFTKPETLYDPLLTALAPSLITYQNLAEILKPLLGQTAPLQKF